MAQVQPDARVTAAAAHWANRFVSNGTDYADFQATLGRITRWDDWCREWGIAAAHYERLAQSAEDACRGETAAGAWQRAVHDRAVACYRRAAAVVDYLTTRDDIDSGRIGFFGVSLGGYYAGRAAAPPITPSAWRRRRRAPSSRSGRAGATESPITRMSPGPAWRTGWQAT
jgi:hypothetical protein